MSGLWVNPSDLGYDDTPYEDLAKDAAASASYLLWALSGRKFNGASYTTERYIRTQASDILGPSAGLTVPLLANGAVINTTGAASPWTSPEARIRLRGQPVTAVHSVRTGDGELVDPSMYTLVDHSTVEFLNLISPYNVEISYSFGGVPPIAGRMAAKQLAKEFMLAWTDDEDCALPSRVTSVTRQGISFTILDNQDFIADLRTGVYMVDLFLKTANPDKARAKAKVFSPDRPRARTYTPKPWKLVADPAWDLVLLRSAGNAPQTFTWSLSTLGAEILADDPAYKPRLILRNYSDTKSVEVPLTAYSISGYDLHFMLTVALVGSALGPSDPGTYDFYVEAPDGSLEHVLQGNISLK